MILPCLLVPFFTVGSLQDATIASAGGGAKRPLFEPELRVLREFDGEAAGDQFGWIGRNAGDCDGDSVNDVLLSAPTRQTGGRVYVYSGKSGALLFTHDGERGDQLGWGIESAGDVDGDGRADVIAGAPGAMSGRGRALVLSGKDGSVLHEFEGEAPGDGFGRKVSGAGDADGDGHADVLVGADLCDSFGADAGRAYLYSGKDGSALLTLDGENSGDKFGVSLCGVTEKGATLIAAGAADAGGNKGGRVYLFRFEKGGVKGDIELLYTIEPEATSVSLGQMFLSFPGDLDGDGTSDLYASDWNDSGKGANTGRIYVYSGRAEKRLFVLNGEHAGDGFGIGTAEAGDVDGDGRADLIIGAWQNAEGAPSGGKCYLFSGKDGALRESWVCTVASETFGFDTTGMGDVDGDGAIDYLITNAWSGVAGKQSGRAFLLAGKKHAPSK